MKFLKVLVLSLFSFLLFLSLTLFGLAFVLNSTLLNPNFVTSEINRIDLASLVAEITRGESAGEQFPKELTANLVTTVTKLEPQLKEQVSVITYSVYDYLLGRSQSLNLARTLRNTILSRDFVVSLVDELDISSLLASVVKGSLEKELGQGTAGIPINMDFVAKVYEDSMSELELWLKEQVTMAADPILDYLFGIRQSFKVVISTGKVKETLKDNFKEALLKSPPPELAVIPPAELGQLFDEFYQQFSASIPSTIELNESLVGTEMPARIAETLAKAEASLAQAKQYVGYFQLGYKVLIGLMLLWVLGIVLINRQVKSITRGLGVTFLTYGVFSYASVMVAKYFMRTRLTLPELPAPLQTWVPQFLGNFLAPLERFSLGFLVGGIVLIIVSFVYRPR